MRLSEILGIVPDIRLSIQLSFLPTLVAILQSPTLIVRPRALSQRFFYHVWILFGAGLSSSTHELKTKLITPNAKGVVLDIGAGLGHIALCLSPDRVTKYVALEPNVLMHPHIKETAKQAGFSEESDTLLILSCGAEDWKSIVSGVGGLNKVDTLVSFMTLCSVPQPQHTIRFLADKVLKPGGQLLFYEHVASKRRDVRFWQWLWSPVWKRFFGGCVLNRPTDDYILELGDVWETSSPIVDDGNRYGIWGLEEEEEENLFWHQIGRLVKRNFKSGFK